MKPLPKLLDQVLDQKEVLRAAKAWSALRHWNEIVGEALAKKSWPDRIHQGTVYVAVQGPAWAQELRMQKQAILERIAERTRDPRLVQDVRFGTRPLPERTTEGAAETTPRSQGPQAAEEEKPELKDLVQKILARAQEE